jgi:hypothetical protein
MLEKNCHTTVLRNAGFTMALRDACICYVNITATSEACDIRDIRSITDVWHTMYSVPTLMACSSHYGSSYVTNIRVT